MADEAVSTSLVGFKFDQPVTVVTWTQNRWVSSYRQSNPTKTGKDVWITVVPHLREFCQDYVRSHAADNDDLALRLKEHLGLPQEQLYGGEYPSRMVMLRRLLGLGE